MLRPCRRHAESRPAEALGLNSYETNLTKNVCVGRNSKSLWSAGSLWTDFIDPFPGEVPKTSQRKRTLTTIGMLAEQHVLPFIGLGINFGTLAGRGRSRRPRAVVWMTRFLHVNGHMSSSELPLFFLVVVRRVPLPHAGPPTFLSVDLLIFPQASCVRMSKAKRLVVATFRGSSSSNISENFITDNQTRLKFEPRHLSTSFWLDTHGFTHGLRQRHRQKRNPCSVRK